MERMCQYFKGRASKMSKKSDEEMKADNLNSKEFDYTEWQQQRFDDISSEAFYDAAVDYEKTYPFETIRF